MGSQMQQHQAGYGLQGNVFGTHSQSHTNTGMQNFNSHFLTTPIQVAAALSAAQAQQFRSSLPAGYMKGVNSQQMGDQSGRPQQLKSPSSQEVLSSVFNTGMNIFIGSEICNTKFLFLKQLHKRYIQSLNKMTT